MTKQEARSYLVAIMKENKFVYPYREEALTIAIAALQEQEERENKIPLTLEEVRRIKNEPVWVCFFGGAIAREDGWFILTDNGTYEYEVLLRGKESFYKSYNYYGRTWIAYKSKPKEEV